MFEYLMNNITKHNKIRLQRSPFKSCHCILLNKNTIFYTYP